MVEADLESPNVTLIADGQVIGTSGDMEDADVPCHDFDLEGGEPVTLTVIGRDNVHVAEVRVEINAGRVPANSLPPFAFSNLSPADARVAFGDRNGVTFVNLVRERDTTGGLGNRLEASADLTGRTNPQLVSVYATDQGGRRGILFSFPNCEKG